MLDFTSINTMERVLNTIYSPNCPSCDFDVFGYVNESLISEKFSDWEEIFEAINHTLEDIEQMTLKQ
jgi:hypothetical protein